MKIPKKLNILGHSYIVIFRDRDKEDGATNPASCNIPEQKIWIDMRASQETQESNFIHEIIEAINYYQALKLEHDKISLLETGLYQVLKDNNWQKNQRNQRRGR